MPPLPQILNNSVKFTEDGEILLEVWAEEEQQRTGEGKLEVWAEEGQQADQPAGSSAAGGAPRSGGRSGASGGSASGSASGLPAPAAAAPVPPAAAPAAAAGGGKRASCEGRGLILHFAVRDTGIGISAENIGRLFQSFSQVRIKG